MSARDSEEIITAKLARMAGSRGVQVGIGDDCAVYRPRGSREDLLFTSDLFIEDVHFRCETHRAEDVAHVALTRSLSDIAAMGGAPRFVLAAVCMPRRTDDRWRNRFFARLVKGASAAGAVLAGGDLSVAEKFSCDITLCGAVARGKALLRSGARAGQDIYVSGRLGGSALGLRTQKGAALRRHVRPQARIELGKALHRFGATSCIDISDGLSLDLRRLCLASGVSAEVQTPPGFPGASDDDVLHGGEEYELLFTVPSRKRVPPTVDNVPLTRIGTISNGRPGDVRLNGAPLRAGGFDHFKTR